MTLHLFIKPDGKLYVIQDMPADPGSLGYYGLTLYQEILKYEHLLEIAKGNAIEVLNFDDVLPKLYLKYKDEYKINASIGEWISQATSIYSLECNVEIKDMLQKRHGTDWHDLPGQKGGREIDGIYRTVKKAIITFEEPEQLQTYNSNKERYIASTNVMTDGFDESWLQLWSEIEMWYGDIRKEETGIEFLTRMKEKFNLSRK